MLRTRTRSKSQAPTVGLINHPLLPDYLDRVQRALARRSALLDLVGSVLVGPPMFPIKHSTAEALFELTLEQLARHDDTSAAALRRYASQSARLEILGLRASTSGLEPTATSVAMLNWLMEEPSRHETDDLRKAFTAYKGAVGKKTCHIRTLRRQNELLRNYIQSHNYPMGSRTDRDQRSVWLREHLPTMVAEVRNVSCWHPQWEDELDTVINVVKRDTSPAKLSALVLAQLHRLNPEYLSKRLLPRRSL